MNDLKRTARWRSASHDDSPAARNQEYHKRGEAKYGTEPVESAPVFAHLEWDYRLNIQYVLNATELADGKVDIVLEWNADEVGQNA